MWFKKKQEPEYKRFEADSYYYEENYIDEYSYNYEEPKEQKKRKKEKKAKEPKRAKRQESPNYYVQSVEDLQGKRRSKKLLVFLTVLFLYIAFIGVGYLSTSFVENEVGEKAPQVADLKMREDRENFAMLRAEYYALTNTMEKINEIDDELGVTGKDGHFLISTKYYETLPDVDSTLPKLKALDIDQKFANIQVQTVGVYESIAIYLQKMGKSLAEGDEVAFDEAMTWREQFIGDYLNLSMNLREFARLVRIDTKTIEDKTIEMMPTDKLFSRVESSF
jgi:hypothetical protein